MEGDVAATASASGSAFNFRHRCVTCGMFGSWTPRMWECDECQEYFLCENCYKNSLEYCEVVPTFPQVMHSQDHCMSSHVTTFYCDGCGFSPIWNQRWHCKVCFDYDLCEACYGSLDTVNMPPEHSKEHPMIDVEVLGLENLLRFQSSFSEPVKDTKLTPCTSHKEVEDVLEKCSSDSVAASPVPIHSSSSQLGADSAAPTLVSEISSSPYVSAPVQGLSELRNAFDNELKLETESSKPHGTQTSKSDDDGCEQQMSNIDMVEKLKEQP